MTNVFISVKEIGDTPYKWIDTRFSLLDEAAGREQYKKSHVEHAVYWHLSEQLSNMNSSNGRHPMPEKEALVELFQNSGLQLDDPIIVYDDGGSPFATRAWWILQYAGFTHAVIALEGFDQFEGLGISVNDEDVLPEKTSVQPKWNEAILATRKEVEELTKEQHNHVLLDARAAVRYRGEVEPLDAIAGHIPTALNFDWEQLKSNAAYNLGFSEKESLHKLVQDADGITVYCGSGVTASPVYAMLRQLGYDNVRLYVGSYSDWISQKDAPVEKGE